jgi:hypothetical protein
VRKKTRPKRRGEGSRPPFIPRGPRQSNGPRPGFAAQKLAEEKPGQTLRPTALVHEAYLRLVGADKVQQWNCRGHFFLLFPGRDRMAYNERFRDENRERLQKPHE